MTVHIGRAISRGIRRTLNPVGIVLMLLTFLYTVGFILSVNTAVSAAVPPDVQAQAQIGLTLPVSPTVAGLLMIVGILVGIVTLLAATRAFTRGPAERDSLSGDLFTRRLGRALPAAIVANIIVFVAVFIGFVLLFVPGIFLAVSFAFVIFAIGVEDAGPVAALRRSWELASGNRWRLFALGLIVAIGTSVLSGIGSVVSVANPTAGQLLSIVITTPLTVLSYGILSDAYIQVRESTDDPVSS